MPPARRSPLTTPRRAAKSQTNAPASTGICHRCWNVRPSGIADPAMAPMTAGPAPVRNDSTELLARIWSKCGAPTSMKKNEGREDDQCCEETPAQTPGRVPDDSHRLDHRARRDLAERHGVEELRARHPVVGDHRVVLHQRNDHEPAAVGERADFEGDPGQRPETTNGCPVEQQHWRGRTGPTPTTVAPVGGWRSRPDRRRGSREPGRRQRWPRRRPRRGRREPSEPARAFPIPDADPAGRDQSPRCAQRHRRHGGSRSRRRAENPVGRVAGQEDHRQTEDQYEPGEDEAQPSEEGSGGPAEPPGTEDRQLRRGGTREEGSSSRWRPRTLRRPSIAALPRTGAGAGQCGPAVLRTRCSRGEAIASDRAQGNPFELARVHATGVTRHGVSFPSSSSASSRNMPFVDSS